MPRRPSAAKPARIILGVDPGTVVTGYGILRVEGRELVLLAQGAIRLDRHKHDQPARLKKIFDTTLGLIDEFKPTELAVEAPFYGTNVQSMLKLGRAQGVVMAAALGRGLAVAEYPPARVKLSVTGRGSASKEQVRQMILRLIPELAAVEQQSAKTPAAYDTTDALAVAICHVYRGERRAASAGSSAKPSKKNWADFVATNPGRVVKP